jgi:transposase
MRAISENVALLFPPPYPPQVNATERLWKALKKEFKWQLFDNLDKLRGSFKNILDKLTVQYITSLRKWQFIVDGLSVPNI